MDYSYVNRCQNVVICDPILYIILNILRMLYFIQILQCIIGVWKLNSFGNVSPDFLVNQFINLVNPLKLNL